MKRLALEDLSIDRCVGDAQEERVVLTRAGKPVALLIGLDEEQCELGTSDEFWKLITERRRQPTISRAELEDRLASRGAGSGD